MKRINHKDSLRLPFKVLEFWEDLSSDSGDIILSSSDDVWFDLDLEKCDYTVDEIKNMNIRDIIAY